jgi:8-amino-7-oxononanoate synthase
MLFMNLPLKHLLSEEYDPFAQAASPSKYGDIFIMESAPGPETVINGKRYIYFGGTGYFALQGHPELIEAGVAAFRKYGVHPATSRTGFGNNPVQLELESKIAAYFGTEDSLHFVSGYLDNLFLVQALKDRVDLIVIDETAHFSITDAVYSAKKPVLLFRHRDPEDLAKKLKEALQPGQVPLLMTDGIFPTMGVIAPIPEYLKIVEPYNGFICLDDSHSVGVLGTNGRGTYEHYGIKSDRCYFAGTMSKAFGGHGGFIPASQQVITHIKTTCGAFAGATPSPTAAIAASLKGLEIVAHHPEMRDRLRKNVAMVKTGLKELGFEMNDNPVPIATWTMKSAEDMKKIQKELLNRGVAVAYTRYVGAPASGALRASIFSEHKPEHIQKLLEEIQKLA